MIATTEQHAGTEQDSSLKTIDDAAKHYRAVFDRAEKLKAGVERERQAVLDANAVNLDGMAIALAAAHRRLQDSIEHGRHHFKKPKTTTLHRVVVGFEKGRNKIETPEEAVLISRIKTMLKAKASTLVRNVESIVKEAFKNLSSAEKQTLGCKVVTGADEVVIRPENNTDVEKYFNARLNAAQTDSK